MLRSVDQLMARPLLHALLAALVFSASFGGCGSSASMGGAGVAGSGGGGTTGGAGAAGTGSGGFTGGTTGSAGATAGVSGGGTTGSAGATAGVSGGAGNGGAGGGGKGGSGGAGGASAGCSAKIATPTTLCAAGAGASCPVLVDATLTCSEGFPFGASVAHGPGDAGYVTLTGRISGISLPFHPQLIRIDPAAAGAPTVEMDPFQAVHMRVATDAAGVPYLFGDEVGGYSVAYGARAAAGWVTETISPADTTQYFISGGAIAADGRAFALFAPADNNSLYLGTRAAAGGWTRDVVSTTHSALAQALALGPTGQVYVAYQVFSGGQALLRLQQGTSAPQLLTSYTSSWGSAKLDVVAPARVPPVVSMDVVIAGSQDIHVFTPGAGAAYVDIAVPGAKIQNATGCENAGCPPATTTCTAKAETTFAGAQALASTADGSVYLAFTKRHVELDTHFERVVQPGGLGICNQITDADRSRTELVIARVPVGGGTTINEVLHVDLGNFSGGVEIDADARDQRLYLVVLGSAGARYLVLDTQKLP
ncbi:MAG TPA: hypothetical protein VIQ54_03870 [Polyangia bacterium]